ncbi:hypothetical protein [Actinomyces naeslundii]|uniref:hypothetical protein n=1 Tax=Actinomyces naeslundii TaxID=1655 RepID=UPI00094C263F|nr:hypothetical protein [Actinomyces naeslundii]OLO90170.1 hypothetical protein BKH10_07410 [Actinomyces naeslundii]
MSTVFELGVWPWVLLTALGGLSIVGLSVTVGARAKLPDRCPWRGEYAVAGTSAALWVAVMLCAFSLAPWWGRLALGAVMALWASLVSRAQLAGLFSAAYVRRKTAEADAGGRED